MTRSSVRSGPAEVRLVEAATWRVHLSEVGAETTVEFEAWLADPANARAWAQVSKPWDYFGGQAHEPELVAAHLAALGAGRVRAGAYGRNVRFRALAAVAAILVIGAAGWAGLQWSQRPDDYRTMRGERRIITLADGSRISLDANSEVTVRFTKNARELSLLEGQARFDVAHDVERPFSVRAGNRKVIATGTVFNIDMAGPKILVTLIEGHVVVLDDSARVGRRQGAPSQVELHAGEQLIAPPGAPSEVERADISRVTAWTNGQIMFDNEALASVASRVNRYASTQIVIDDPRIANMRISGLLNAGDVDGFVDMVTHYLPVQAVNGDNGDITLVSESKK